MAVERATTAHRLDHALQGYSLYGTLGYSGVLTASISRTTFAHCRPLSDWISRSLRHSSHVLNVPFMRLSATSSLFFWPERHDAPLRVSGTQSRADGAQG